MNQLIKTRLVGGPKDGDTTSVDISLPVTVMVADYGRMRALDYRELGESVCKEEARQYPYEKMYLYADGREYFLYRYHKLRPSDVIDRLIAGYNPRGERR